MFIDCHSEVLLDSKYIICISKVEPEDYEDNENKYGISFELTQSNSDFWLDYDSKEERDKIWDNIVVQLQCVNMLASPTKITPGKGIDPGFYSPSFDF